MNQFSKEEIYQEIGEIVSKFKNMECDKGEKRKENERSF